MSNLENQPTSLIGPASSSEVPKVFIGSKKYLRPSQDHNAYWYLVVSRTDLSVVANVLSASNSSYPEALKKYLGNNMFYLFVIGVALRSDNLPTGDLFTMLKKVGAGVGLLKAQQLATQLGTATYGFVVYILAVNLDEGEPGAPFEQYSFYDTDAQMMPLTFVPFEHDGNVIWTLSNITTGS